MKEKPEKFSVRETELKGVLLIAQKVYTDERGHFFDAYVQEELQRYGIPLFVQQSQSFSHHGVVRGLHFQKTPYAQAKLVRVVQGKILDVVVDLRKSSPTYGKYLAIELSHTQGIQVFIPEGFAHGFSVLSPQAMVLYNLSKVYNPLAEGGIHYDDPSLAIDWKVGHARVSEKDGQWPHFSALGNIFE